MASGADVLAVALNEVRLGVKEHPPGSNNVKYWVPWGSNWGAWCYAFVTWCCEAAGAPLPQVQKVGLAGVQLGVQYSLNHPGEVVCCFDSDGRCIRGNPADCQPGDIVHFSWLRMAWENGWPWVLYGGKWVTAGDHVGFFHSWAGGGLMNTVEGNTSVNGSQDNGGAVLQRQRPVNVICNVWRPAVYDRFSTPSGPLVPATRPQEKLPMPALVKIDDAGTLAAVDGVFFRRKRNLDVVNAELAAGVYAKADTTNINVAAIGESIDIEAILWAINTGANNTDRTVSMLSALADVQQRQGVRFDQVLGALELVSAVADQQQRQGVRFDQVLGALDNVVKTIQAAAQQAAQQAAQPPTSAASPQEIAQSLLDALMGLAASKQPAA